MVTIGYAFGILCRKDGKYVVFDTHKKSFGKFGKNDSGAYFALLKDEASAGEFIDQFTLDSRAQILSMAQGFQQSQAASNIDITIIKRTKKKEDTQKKEKKKEEKKNDIKKEETTEEDRKEEKTEIEK